MVIINYAAVATKVYQTAGKKSQERLPLIDLKFLYGN